MRQLAFLALLVALVAGACGGGASPAKGAPQPAYGSGAPSQREDEPKTYPSAAPSKSPSGGYGY